MRTALKITGTILKWTVIVLLLVLLIANLYTVIARQITDEPQPDVFGWSWAVVVSGSMEPEISVNDLIIVKAQDDYNEKDIICYKSDNSVVTHRIVEKGDGYYITQGDSNNTADEPVLADAVIGKVTAAVPYVGLVIGYLRTPVGMFCSVLLGLLLIQIPYFIDRLKKDKGGCG